MLALASAYSTTDTRKRVTHNPGASRYDRAPGSAELSHRPGVPSGGRGSPSGNALGEPSERTSVGGPQSDQRRCPLHNLHFGGRRSPSSWSRASAHRRSPPRGAPFPPVNRAVGVVIAVPVLLFPHGAEVEHRPRPRPPSRDGQARPMDRRVAGSNRYVSSS
jgi:hypothetical protein